MITYLRLENSHRQFLFVMLRVLLLLEDNLLEITAVACNDSDLVNLLITQYFDSFISIFSVSKTFYSADRAILFFLSFSREIYIA
jgi:hypothetical protein